MGNVETVTTCTPGYGWQERDIIETNDGLFIVTEVVSATTLTMRRMLWWERAWLSLKRLWRSLIRHCRRLTTRQSRRAGKGK